MIQKEKEWRTSKEEGVLIYEKNWTTETLGFRVTYWELCFPIIMTGTQLNIYGVIQQLDWQFDYFCVIWLNHNIRISTNIPMQYAMHDYTVSSIVKGSTQTLTDKLVIEWTIWKVIACLIFVNGGATKRPKNVLTTCQKKVCVTLNRIADSFKSIASKNLFVPAIFSWNIIRLTAKE